MRMELSHIAKSFGGVPVLRDVSLALEPDRAVCVMGRSGAGKTTLARILLGLETPDAGTVRGTRGARFAVSFQEDRLLGWLSAAGNLRFACGALDDALLDAAFAAVGLAGEDRHKPAASLSGGQRRRVSLLRALLAPADAVVLDEPFTGLDARAREEAAAYTRARCAGRILLCITHEPGDAALLGARVFSLD